MIKFISDVSISSSISYKGLISSLRTSIEYNKVKRPIVTLSSYILEKADRMNVFFYMMLEIVRSASKTYCSIFS